MTATRPSESGEGTGNPQEATVNNMRREFIVVLGGVLVMGYAYVSSWSDTQSQPTSPIPPKASAVTGAVRTATATAIKTFPGVESKAFRIY